MKTPEKAPLRRRTRTPSNAPARLSDVAALAGVSTGTVSRVFSAPEQVAPATAKLVRAAADKLGWISHGGARALASHRSRTIGAVIPNLSNPVFAQMMYGLQDRLLSQRYTLLLNCSDYDPQKALISTRSMMERGVDGLILLGENFPDSLWHLLTTQKVPSLIIYSYRELTGRTYVGVDNIRAAREAADHILDLGHRDILVLSQEVTDNDRVAARLYGFREALRNRGIVLDETRTAFRPWSIQAGYDFIVELVARGGQLPTAILCTNDFHALGVLSACREMSIRVPQDVSVVGFDDLEMTAFVVPPLTTMRVPAREMGDAAGKVFVEHLDRQVPLASVEFVASLVVRKSTAAPRQSTD